LRSRGSRFCRWLRCACCRRCASSRGGGRCGTRRAGCAIGSRRQGNRSRRWRRRRRTGGRQTIQHAATDTGMPRRTEIRQGERGREKNHRSNAGRFRQEIGGPGRAEQAAGRARPEGRTHVRALAVLHQNETDNGQRRQDLHQNHDIDKQSIH